jgi:hypothetical protein
MSHFTLLAFLNPLDVIRHLVKSKSRVNHVHETLLMKLDEFAQVTGAVVPPPAVGHDEEVSVVSLGLAYS